ncbi:MAG: glutathione S-transferase [Burkholderiales bacterium]|nr:glutathione S-transferase [Burkholderiales bacterium]
MSAAMSSPLLYSFRRCPYAIRARLALAQAGVAVHTVEVDLKHKPADLLAVSPEATVPVLVQPNGQVLTQSLDIMRWALAQHDPAGWLLSRQSERDEMLIKTTDTAFKHWLDRYKYAERHPDQPREHYRQQAVSCLMAPLEQALSADGPWLGGAQPVLADAAICPFVRQFAAVEPAWWASSPFPATRAWLHSWLASDLFAGVMRKPVAARVGQSPDAIG